MLRKNGEDRRTKKTRTALQEALISLMFEKSYEAILIQEILDRANVGRSTFYTHFSDKDELLAEGLGQLGRHGPRQNVSGAAGRERNHDLHRLDGPAALGQSRQCYKTNS